ncbi:MAG: glycosyltransferase family 4 protein, partial [Actinomycetota bacterium]|nr:glycosyltransferase family 4 protein [Actinomycetota bacterium]
LVGAAGRIDTWKGFHVLLDAAAAMQSARPGLELVIAGGPVTGKEGYADALAGRAADMAGVHWLGPRDDMAELIADLDVLVLPSTEPEPFGLVLVEALASGVPVVATAAGGPVEILRSCSQRVARLVAPGDPAALAQATIQLLTPGPSSSLGRRQRRVLRTPVADSLPTLFDELVRP